MMSASKERFSVGIKQFGWFLPPFFAVYLLEDNPDVKTILSRILPFFVTVTLLFGPFLLWDAKSFIEDTMSYVGGAVDYYNFPLNGVKGLGFANFVITSGVVGSIRGYFPFWILQAAFTLPVIGYLMLCQRRNNAISLMLLSFGVSLFTASYFSRFMHDNHLTLVASILAMSAFIDE